MAEHRDVSTERPPALERLPLSIPFNKPRLEGREFEYMAQAVRQGHISGDGSFTKRCQALLEEVLHSHRVLLTTSCTHALEMTALLLNLEPGDEVIVPAFSFVSTVNAYVLRGARPVFADVRPDTLNLDESQLPGLISPRTRAIVVVHYAGVGAEMDPILSFASEHEISVVEDNAHGLFGRYRGRWLGTLAPLATMSFHETKNFSCGEGGALSVNDPAFADRAEILREKGTDRSRFFRGQVDKYTWVDLGSSYVISDLLAAYLLAQLEARETIQAARRRIWQTYAAALAAWAAEHGVGLPTVPEHCEPTHHLFYLMLPSIESRTRLIDHLRSRGILGVFHYQSLNLAPMGLRFGGRRGDCPVSERASDCLVRLPIYNSLAPDEQERVIEAILACPV